MIRGKSEVDLCEKLQRALTAAGEWCNGKGLNLNANKNTILPFTKKMSALIMEPIFLNATEIQIASEKKILGVIFDRKLLWKPHLDAIIKKATISLMICRRLAGKSWGCSPNHIRWMFTMMVKPIITYVVRVWSKRVRQKTTQSSLSKVQRLACLITKGAMCTCPTVAMEAVLDFAPLHLEL